MYVWDSWSQGFSAAWQEEAVAVIQCKLPNYCIGTPESRVPNAIVIPMGPSRYKTSIQVIDCSAQCAVG